MAYGVGKVGCCMSLSLSFALAKIAMWRCSCDLCGRYYGGPKWGYHFPADLVLRRDLDNQLGEVGPPEIHAVYAAHYLPRPEQMRASIEAAGWKVLRVSADGVNFRDVLMCSVCLKLSVPETPEASTHPQKV